MEMFGDPVSNPKHWKTAFLLDIGYCKNGMNFHKGDSGVDIHCLGVGDFKNRTMIQNVEDLPLFHLMNCLILSIYLEIMTLYLFVLMGTKNLWGAVWPFIPEVFPLHIAVSVSDIG